MYEEYRDSGVMWLGRIPAHWEIGKIGYLFVERKTKVSDKVYQPLSVTKKGILPQLENAAKSDDSDNRKLVCAGDFVINSRSDRKGSCGISDFTGSVSLINIVLIPRDILHTRYVYYLLGCHSFSEEYYRHGKGIVDDLWTTRYRDMASIYIPVPPLHEQHKIAHYLDRITSFLDRMIETRRNELAAFIEFRKAIISQEVSRGDWPQVKLRHILRPVSVKNHPELPLLSVTREKGVIIRDIEDFETNRNFIPDDLSGYKVVRPGQLVINKMKAWQGSCGISDYTGIVSPAYFVFDVNFDNLRFFHHAIRSSIYADFFAQASGGIRVGQWDLQMDKIKDSPFPCPPAHEQHRIANFLNNICSHINNIITIYTQQIPLLHELKASIINNAVTGQIDLRDIHIP